MKYKCIYCGEEKKSSEFNREHVLPGAFGKFKNNYVLHNVVCKDCNQEFGESIEWVLSYDTFEGHLRYNYEIKKRIKAQRTNNLEIRIDEGELKGCPAEINEENEVVPQKGCIGIYDNEKGQYSFFYLDNIFVRDKLPCKYFNAENKVYFLFDFNDDETKNRLVQLGYNLDFKNDSIPIKFDGSVDVHFRRILDSDIGRAVSKIAFNYLAYKYGTEYVNLECFNPIRDFIKYDKGDVNDYVSLQDEPLLQIEKERSQRVLGHLIGLEWLQDGKVIAYVSLFSTIVFKIILTKNVTIYFNKNSCGVFFNLNPEHREIISMEKSDSSSLLHALGIKIRRNI